MLCPAPVVRAVLIEPALPVALEPLSADGSWCGLSLVNHALIERVLEDLARAGIREVRLLHQKGNGRAASLVGLGGRWGLELHVESIGAGTPPSADDAAASVGHGPTLFLRLDCWPGAEGLRALLQGSCVPQRRLAGPGGALPCSVFAGGSQRIDSTVYCRDSLQVATLADYWSASMELLARLHQTNHLERALEGQRFIGAGARLHRSAQVDGPCLIGSGAFVARGCGIGPRSIVGDGVYLDAQVRISDSIVLGDCHVESGAQLHGVVVTGDQVHCWRTGRVLAFDRTVVLPKRWPALRSVIAGPAPARS